MNGSLLDAEVQVAPFIYLGQPAIQVVIRSAGKDFDPQVVNLLAARYTELENKVREADWINDVVLLATVKCAVL